MKAFQIYVRQEGMLSVRAETYGDELRLARRLLDSGSAVIEWEKPVILEEEEDEDDEDD